MDVSNKYKCVVKIYFCKNVSSKNGKLFKLSYFRSQTISINQGTDVAKTNITATGAPVFFYCDSPR